MWNDETSATSTAETAVSMNPWASGMPQTQAWQGMPGRGMTGGIPGQSLHSTPHPQHQQPLRAWDGMQSTGAGWPSQMQQQQQPWAPIGNAWSSHVSSQPQWGPTSNSPSGTYADQTKKNMSMRPGPGPQPTMRFGDVQQPAMSSHNQPIWGGNTASNTGSGIKVDQQTPWDTTASAAGNDQWSMGAAPPHRWGQQTAPMNGVINPAAAGDWMSNQHRPAGDVDGTGHWAPPTSQGGSNWSANMGPAGPNGVQVAGDSTPGPWIAPQPAEMNNDLMWHDPNPKQKKIQRDTGTQVWGDPCGQREIRRWKAGEDESAQGSPGGSHGVDWTTLPTPTDSQAAAIAGAIAEPTGWGDPPPGDPNSDSQWGGNGSSWSTSEPKRDSSSLEGPDMRSVYDVQQQTQQRPAASKSASGILVELIQLALSRGIINVGALQRCMQNQQYLAELQKQLQSLFGSEKLLIQLRQFSPNNTVSASEEERLMCEIQHAKSQLAEMQQSLGGGSSFAQNSNTGSGNSSHNGSLNSNSESNQSRLQLYWKKSSEGGGCDENSIGAGLQSLIADTQNLSIHPEGERGWKSGALDWSPPNTVGMNGCESQERRHSNGASYGGDGPKSDGNLTPTLGAGHEGGHKVLDDGPPEFVPGKKWEWRDPNKVAEDPNATPAMHKPLYIRKPTPLLNAGVHQLSSSGLQHTSQALNDNTSSKNFSSWGSNENAAPYFGGNPSGDMWNKSAPGVPQQPMGMMGTPPPGMGAVYGESGNNRFIPPFNASGMWILFQLININPQQIQMLISRIGRLQSFMIVGHKIACAKFVGSNIEVILQRIKDECVFAPQHVKVVSDDEFDKMMQSSRASNMAVTNVWNAGVPNTDMPWGCNPQTGDGGPPQSFMGGNNPSSDGSGRPF